jgi:hypothetical protein
MSVMCEEDVGEIFLESMKKGKKEKVFFVLFNKIDIFNIY